VDLNLRENQSRTSVSSMARSEARRIFWRYCRPTNQARGVTKSKESKDKSEVGESRDWERMLMRTRETERVTEGGF